MNDSTHPSQAPPRRTPRSVGSSVCLVIGLVMALSGIVEIVRATVNGDITVSLYYSIPMAFIGFMLMFIAYLLNLESRRRPPSS